MHEDAGSMIGAERTMLSPEVRNIALTVSWLCGWLYFLAWSASFYPQPMLNVRRRTTRGVMPDFPQLNVLGFASYTISTAIFLFSPAIRQQYALRHPQAPVPTVRANDLAFGVHALIMCTITYSQFWPSLWGFEREGISRRVTRVTSGIVWGALLGVAIVVTIVIAHSNNGKSAASDWAWIDAVYTLWYVKLLLTIFKYIPQAVANFQRKSTTGWSIVQVLLDFSGGILSMAQLCIDSALQGDWSGLTGNPVKFGLANISLMFDLVFMTQHYILYGPVAEKAGKEESKAVEPAQQIDRGERQPLLARY